MCNVSILGTLMDVMQDLVTTCIRLYGVKGIFVAFGICCLYSMVFAIIFYVVRELVRSLVRMHKRELLRSIIRMYREMMPR